MITMCGFCILNCILGGQALAAVANNNLSWKYVSFAKLLTTLVSESINSIGIVIIAVISLLVCA